MPIWGNTMSKTRQSGDSIQQVAGNGLLDRRALLGRGIMLAGAAGVAGSLTGAAAEPLAEAPWSTHPGNPVPPYQRPSPFEDKVVRTVDNQNNAPGGQRARTPHQLLRGHHHAQRPALHHHACRHSGHRSRPAQARHPRDGAAAAGIHRREPDALPDGVARGLHRMRRQQCAAVLQRADPGQPAGAAWSLVLRRMVRRAARDPARRSRRRPEGEVDHRRGRGFSPSHPQRAAQEDHG